MENVKQQLQEKLVSKHCYWSYANGTMAAMNDDLLIENSLLYLDLDDINRLFSVYPYGKVRRIWAERLVRQNDRYRELNLLLAVLYFGAKSGEHRAMVNNIYKKLKW